MRLHTSSRIGGILGSNANGALMAHTFQQLTDHTYWLSPDSATDRPVLGLVAGAKGTLVIDGGNSPSHAHVLLDQLAAARLAPPRYLVITHWHWDHWFGAAAFDLPAFAHAQTRRLLVEQAAWDWSDAALDERVAQGTEIAFCRDMLKAELPDRSDLVLRPPDIAFTGALDIDLGGVTCRLIHVGGDHAADSTIVFVPEERAVFLSDCRYEDLYVTPRRYTTAKVIPLFDRLLGLEADIYLGGHETEPITKAALTAEAALLCQIGQTVDRTGGDRDAVLAALQRQAGQPLAPDWVEIADMFLAGIRPSQ